MTNNKRRLLGAAALIASLTAVSFSSSAALINRGSGMIYDTVLNITWLQDANLIQTSGYDVDGLVNYSSALNWVNNLSFGGYDDWRLPSVTPEDGSNVFDTSFTFNGTSDRGFNNDSSNSELGYMFYQNLGNVSFYSTAGTGPQAGSDVFNSSFIDGDSGIEYSFSNIGRNYWASQGNIPWGGASWGFAMQNGSVNIGEQAVFGLAGSLNVWAVRDGDVASTLNNNPDPDPNTGQIPEPGSLALITLGLFGALYRRKMS